VLHTWLSTGRTIARDNLSRSLPAIKYRKQRLPSVQNDRSLQVTLPFRMIKIDPREKLNRTSFDPSGNMLRKQRETLLQVSFYALFACVVFVVGKATWSERRSSGSYYNKPCNNASTTASSTPFASFATLHLPFAALPPQVIHLGTDAMPINTPSSSGGHGIGKCTVMHGKYGSGDLSAFDTHLRHSEIHHYPIFVLDRPIVDGLWSKEAALLAVLLHEMSKPKETRLRWLMWFDADTLVVNPLIPAETFLPPEDGLDGINLLVTADWNGLNNGVFLLRVCAWSVDFLTNILSDPSYKPDEDLPFSEQSATERTTQDPRYASACIYVPPRWFNSYPRCEDEPWTKYQVERGDMMVHFAVVGDRPGMIRAFYEHVASEREKWEVPIGETTLPEEIAGFWRNVRMQRGSEV
jgi:hypothetical protein